MWIYFTPFSSVSIGDFEQVNVDWDKGHRILFAKYIVWEQYQDLYDIADVMLIDILSHIAYLLNCNIWFLVGVTTLSSWPQNILCLWINKVKKPFHNTIFWVSRGFIVSCTLYNCFSSKFFLVIRNTSVNNFVRNKLRIVFF